MHRFFSALYSRTQCLQVPFRVLTPIVLLSLSLAACAPPTAPPPTATQVQAAITATGTVTPTKTPSPTATALRTPPALPEIFLPAQLDPNDYPQTYVDDTCVYLKNRWEPGNAAPGTVVMIVMLSSINRGAKPNASDSITVNQFERMIGDVKEQGFKAINSEQLLGFLENNRYIPPRSILFLQDGRRTAGNFDKHFRPMWEDWGWPVVNSWIIQTSSPDSLVQENLALEREGFVDHQLYSSLHRFSDNASEEFLSGELKKYTDIFEDRYNKTPRAITWPSKPGIHFIPAARNLGIQLGFTANARGPVSYNWIPLSDHEDSKRPAYYPEMAFNDPLMTLPRYWPSQVVKNLDQVRLIGKGAAEFAEQNKELELEYYDIVCAGEYGEIFSEP